MNFSTPSPSVRTTTTVKGEKERNQRQIHLVTSGRPEPKRNLLTNSGET